MNLIIADDEEIILKSFVKRIHRMEIPVRAIYEANNGLEALEIFRQYDIHIALIDINMPFLNGLELMKRIREISTNTRIIVISGYDNFEYAQEAIKYNVYRYLLKPINPSEFVETIQSAVEQVKQDENYLPADTPELREIIECIDIGFADSEYNLTALAEHVGKSEGHISKLLKKSTGYSFSDYLTKKRLDKAKQLLKAESGMIKMYEVAELVGYKNQHYFSQVFKKIEGVSPKDYRG